MTSSLQFDGHRLLDYDLWANLQMLDALQATQAPQRAYDIFAHMIAAAQIWLARAQGRATPAAQVWPSADLSRAADDLQAMRRQWDDLLRTRNPMQTIEYLTTKGDRWSSRLADIVTHLVLHSAYHRGQIAMLLGSAGATPAQTDFIVAARTGIV